VLFRAGAFWLMSDALQTDPDGYRRLAVNLVEHGTFGQGDAPTAYRPPLYPLLLTGCVALGDWCRPAVGALHVVLGAATVMLVFVLAQWWGLGRGGATIASLLVACDPILLSQSAQVMTETTAVFFAAVGLVMLTWAARRPSAARMFLTGVALGLGSLCRPSLLPWAILAGAVFAWPWLFRRTLEKIISPASFFIGLLLVLAPWAARNQLQFARPIVTTTHGGYTLLLANNPSFYQWLRSGRWGSVWSAEGLTDGWNRRRPRDELAADRAAYAEAIETIRQQPGVFCYSCLVRLGRFWSPLAHQITPTESPLRRWSRWSVAAWYSAEFFFAALGCFAIAWRGNAATWLFGFLLAVSLMASHAFYWTDMRMRAPLMPLVALAAAAGLTKRKTVSEIANSVDHG
jgi:4-amino-4-deoxy-L-arabinose transferase-like glycosyltransferase